MVDAYIRNHLIEYCGKIQIAQMGEEKWKEYPLWRKRTGKGARGEPVQDGTIRHELITFRAILRYAADKHLLSDSSVPITPSKNADLILQGIPGWEPAKQGSAAGSEVSVNADGGGKLTARSRSPKR